jgi:NAD(P)-dependent dehydrogenase (short-subunit alcohol dehydrogenase family)
VNIGSIDGILAPSLETYAYSASKAAVHHLTRNLAKHLAKDHINVNAIAPGPFETKMLAPVLAASRKSIEASVPLGRIGRDDDMIGAAIFYCSKASSYITATVLPVDGGLSGTPYSALPFEL